MAQETRCTWTHGTATDEGTALLADDEIVLRGAAQLVVKRKDLARFDVEGDVLALSHKKGMTRIALGRDVAESWSAALRGPDAMRGSSRGARKRAKAAGSDNGAVDVLSPDLRRRLESEPAAKAAFLKLTPAQQRGIVVSLDGIGGKEGRAALIERVVASLRDGTLKT